MFFVKTYEEPFTQWHSNCTLFELKKHETDALDELIKYTVYNTMTETQLLKASETDFHCLPAGHG